jgi:hypothetical protein
MNNVKNNNTAGIEELGPKIAAWAIVAIVAYLFITS